MTYLKPNYSLTEEDSDPEKDDQQALEAPVWGVKVADVGSNKDVLDEVHIEAQNS